MERTQKQSDYNRSNVVKSTTKVWNDRVKIDDDSHTRSYTFLRVMTLYVGVLG